MYLVHDHTILLHSFRHKISIPEILLDLDLLNSLLRNSLEVWLFSVVQRSQQLDTLCRRVLTQTENIFPSLIFRYIRYHGATAPVPPTPCPPLKPMFRHY